MASPPPSRALTINDPLLFGEAIVVTLLLSDWDKFGLSERACYHFDLIETLTSTAQTEEKKAEYHRQKEERNKSSAGDGVCGVVSLLECIPKSSKYRRKLRSRILGFNQNASQVVTEAKVGCHEPAQLPLKLSPATRVSFAYEITRVAFCLDASPTLVATYGNGLDDDGLCCAMDRVESMSRTFFKALVKPLTASWLADSNGWRPILAVTVLAVYPNATGVSDTSLLIRDFRVHDLESAERLSKEIGQWGLNEVENEIARRMSHKETGWCRPPPSSSLRDIIDAGDVALSLLPSSARPCLVVTTDCRSVACESILDIFQNSKREDTPLVVLDLSSPGSHVAVTQKAVINDNPISFLTYDPGSSSSFPLHLSDDSEALFGICRVTGGAFFNKELLEEAAHCVAGKIPVNSPIAADSYFAFKRRVLRPNAIQWYTLFSFSPLSPTLHPAWGKLAPPTYIQRKLAVLSGRHETASHEEALHDLRSSYRSLGSFLSSSSLEKGGAVPFTETPLQGRQTERTVFSMYAVSPVLIKGLLLTRIKEGYRAKQYGQSTQDPDKVSTQFTLGLEHGTVLHYELSYKALQDQNLLVGVANIKIELSGEKNFIQSVKNDFQASAAHVQQVRAVTIAMKASAKLCKFLRGIRKEDCLQAYLSPLSWADRVSTSDSPFFRRLGTLTNLQRRLHFRLDVFDVVCVGHMPYEFHDDLILSELIDFDSGEQELYDALSSWSTHTIEEKRRYEKRSSSSCDDLVAYYVIEVERSGSTSRIVTISMETFGGSSAVDRLAMLSSLKDAISCSSNVAVLQKPMTDFLVGLRDPLNPVHRLAEKQPFLKSHFHHESWDGGTNLELLTLLTRRRNEVGEFLFLHSSDTYSLFAKLVTDDGGRLVTADFTNKSFDSALSSELYQVQYQVAVISGSVLIDMHLEREQGVFFTRSMQPRFHDLFDRVKVHDQECGRALGSRACLLSLLTVDESTANEPANHQLATHVERLLKYASKLSRPLRFYNSSATIANKILEELTVDLILSVSLNMQVRRLALDVDACIDDTGGGIWFLIQFDTHTIGFAHLECAGAQVNSVDAERSFMVRNLTFYSIGITDLYCKRDLIADEDLGDDHISEYLCVSDFADKIEALHGKNFSRAAYLAARHAGSSQKVPFDSSDFHYALSFCSFVEVKRLTLSQELRHAEIRESNLFRAFGSLLTMVPGDKFTLFYPGAEQQASEDLLAHGSGGLNRDDDDDDDDVSDTGTGISDDGVPGFSDDDMGGNDGSVTNEHESIDTSSHGFTLSTDGTQGERPFFILPPIFVQLTVDGELVAPYDFSRINRTATLTARMSIFDASRAQLNKSFEEIDPSSFPKLSYFVALQIRSVLDSYVAEQLLERFREYGMSVSRSEIKVVKQCLQRARNVLSSEVRIQFYDAKSDSMVRHPAPSIGNVEMEQVASLLYVELQEDNCIKLNPISPHGFLVDDRIGESLALKYWGFVTVKMRIGVINVSLYHPDGEWKSQEALSTVHDHVLRTMRRVNQVLLLRSLHRNRTASSFLIPGGGDFDEYLGDAENLSGTMFTPGSFGCPIKYKASFPLFHRCVATQVVVSLEVTVLHSFAVSNRRGVFVYKDESDAIFYMKLMPAAGRDNDPDRIELLVYGLREPGPSITRQLARLLQRRLLTLGVDALSAVLTKNPHYHWKALDTSFVRSFEESWLNVADENDTAINVDNDIEYTLPSYLYDPIMLLVCFRQNICGSTFFHLLQKQSAETESTDDKDNLDCIPEVREGRRGMVVPFDSREFSLFYNNAPSPLDPEFQPVCTLTHKAEDTVGQLPDRAQSMPALNIDSLRLHRVDNGYQILAKDQSSDLRIRVCITDTALDREVLHNWVLLSLNQVLVAWIVERHIQRMESGLLLRTPQIAPGDGFDRDQERNVTIDSLKPGLPYLLQMLDVSYNLPHPAIEKLEMTGVIQSSSLATTGLQMAEKMLNTLTGKDHVLALSQMHESLRPLEIRLSKMQQSQLVDLSWDPSQKSALVSKLDSKSFIQDSPIENTEYLFFYCFNHYSDDLGRSDALSPSALCFPQVMVDVGSGGRGVSAFTEALKSFRQSSPSTFSQSLAFAFSVTRNRRSLITYNWNPQVWNSVATHLREAHSAHLDMVDSSVRSVQKRCLRILAPPITSHERPGGRRQDRSTLSKMRPTKSSDEKDRQQKREPLTKSLGDKSEKKATTRDSQLPQIRRPKLVGKSVEGAAMQAMAASRARASATRFASLGSPLAKGRRDKATASRALAIDRGPRETAKSLDEDKCSDSQSDQKQESSVDALSVVVTEYFATISEKLPSPFHQARMVQALISRRWLDRPVNFLIRDFLLSRAVPLWGTAIEIFSYPSRMLKDVGGYLAQWLQMSDPEFDLLQLDAPSQAPALVSPTSILLVKLKRIRKQTLCVALRTSVKLDAGPRHPSLRCEAWMMMLSPDGTMAIRRKRTVRRMAIRTLERGATLMDKKIGGFEPTIDLEVQFFNLSAFLLQRSLQSWKESLRPGEMMPLVADMVQRFPLERQMKMDGLKYAVFEATIVLSSYQDKFIDFYDSNRLFGYLFSNASNHDMIVCNADGLCFKQSIPVHGSESICFLTRDTRIVGKMQLVLVCRLEGHRLHHYIFHKGNPIGAQLLDLICVSAARVGRDTLHAAALNIRRDELWSSFVVEKSTRAPNHEELKELLGLVSSGPLIEGDSRLHAVIVNHDDEYGLDWCLCCRKMAEDPIFTPHWTFREGNSTRNLFYMRPFDEFLCLWTDDDGSLREAQRLWRDSSHEDSKRLAIQAFANYLIHYLWHSL